MEEKQLIKQAEKAMSNSYSPYSKFKVGAALLTKDGEVYPGANIENASYPLAMCAERNAVYHALNRGVKKEDIVALAIIGDTTGPISPCGACRQVLHELLPRDAVIYLASTNGSVKKTSTTELLPFAFDESDL
ncbi:MAG TPA: cytidine deaminase [Bacilli bacterium]|nr:cytidine deaminase [Bacilli bacterium]